MMRVVVMVSLLLAGATLSRVSGEEVECGLKAGDGAAPFNVLDVTGPNKDKSLCYR
jgi:hypothetical protein